MGSESCKFQNINLILILILMLIISCSYKMLIRLDDFFNYETKLNFM